MLNKLGKYVATHRISAILLWLLILLTAAIFSLTGIAGPSLFQKAGNSVPSVKEESFHARQMLGETEEDNENSDKNIMLMVTQTPLNPTDPKMLQYTQLLNEYGTEIKSNPAVTEFDNPLTDTAKQAALISPSKDGFLVNVVVDNKKATANHNKNLDALKTKLNDLGNKIKVINPTAQTDVGGSIFINEEFKTMTKHDLEKAEVSSLPFALIIMVLMFGGFLAAGIPLISALATITCALGIVWISTFFISVDTMVINTISIVALGLAIDYGLFIVSRFREEYQHLEGGTEDEKLLNAIGLSIATAGKTVIFSGITVALCLSALLVFEPTLIKNIAFGGVMAVLISIVTSILLIPALLSIFGKKLVQTPSLYKIPKLGPLLSKFGMIAPENGFFSKLTRKVQQHPWVAFLGTLALLLAMASPAIHMKAENSTLESLGDESPSLTFFNNLEENFPYAISPYAEIVTDASPEKLQDYITSLGNVNGIKSFTPVATKNGNAFSIVQLEHTKGNDQTGPEVVSYLRDHRPADFNTWITGSEADSLDFNKSMMRQAPLAAVIIGLATFFLLFLMTGSLMIPLKALIISAISLSATLGMLTWGFQDGHLAQLLHFNAQNVTGVDTIMIIFVLVFGFGLAMDYEMFLISRVKEHHDKAASNDESIALGLQNSGRIITSAAIIIMTVFIGFTFGDLLQLKEIGAGLAFAVLLDATIVRCLLVPATMTLMGAKWNWWAPQWVKNIYEKIGMSH
ncbi:MAG: MMPL family transporter [Micrococcaceae bacterium]